MSKQKSEFKTPKWKLLTATLLFLLIIFAIFGEIILRLTNYDVKGAITPPYNTALKDEQLGWIMTPNYTYNGRLKDKAGEEYDVNLKFDANGFKLFGNLQSDKPKILVVGDSYTASVETSNDKTYYNYLKDSLSCEVFAYGHAGYGNLQEYLILDKWLDKIKPDLVLMEVCSNDYMDNYAPLEIACGYKVGDRRPYLEDNGEIKYYRPLSSFQKVKEKSKFVKWFSERLENTWHNITNTEKRVGEYYIANDQLNYAPFRKSSEVTAKIIKKIKNRIPADTKFLAFSADSYQPSLNTFEGIFSKQGLNFTKYPVSRIDSFEYFKLGNVRSADTYHWNNLGQMQIALGLIKEIRERNLLIKK